VAVRDSSTVLPFGCLQIRLHIPEQCKFCGGKGTVIPEHTIRGTHVALRWWCNRCDRDWPTSVQEQQPERRGSEGDRRETPRGGDRRGPDNG
jgi:hypothetical protein